MKLAVRKEPGYIPGSGFHYMLFCVHPMEDEMESAVFARMGHIIIDVPDEDGQRMMNEARAALKHQMEIAYLADAAERRGETN
jgi:hypothetical protein